MVDFPRCRVATWVEVDRWADEVAAQIRAVDRIPDTIVGLTRGGWVPARVLADRLSVKRLVSLRAQHWGVTATPQGRAELTEGLSGSVAGGNVLIADDITDTGESLALALEAVHAQRPQRAESATFLHISHARHKPTYFAEEIPKESWVWIVFPWNYWEDLGTLGTRAREINPSLEEIGKVLRERCGISIPAEHLEHVARLQGWE